MIGPPAVGFDPGRWGLDRVVGYKARKPKGAGIPNETQHFIIHESRITNATSSVDHIGMASILVHETVERFGASQGQERLRRV